MRINPEIHEFFVEGSEQERSHVLLHITEPGTPEERAKGYFFALAEINNGSIEQIEHLQQMIDDLESGYYETEDQEEKNAFEVTLEYINRRGHHILQYKNSVISCLVGVLRGHDLFFAFHGSPQALLFYKEKNEYQIMDALADQDDAVHGQLFSSLLQGSINDGDFFYVSTPQVNDYFAADRVQKILTGRSTRQSASHIQKVLKELNNAFSFGGILLHYPDRNELTGMVHKIKNGVESGSVASLDKLIGQERSTEEILSPPLLGMLKKKFHNFQEQRALQKKKAKLLNTQAQRRKEIEAKKPETVETNFRPREEKKKSESVISLILISLGKAIVAVLIAIFNFFKKAIPLLGRGLVALIILITNRNGQRQEIIRQFKNYLQAKKEELDNLPLISKILLFGTIILGLIFIGSILTFKIRTNIQAKNLAYNNQVQAILDKKTAADASLIYEDENKALILLQEAKKIISELPKGSSKEKDKIAELNASIESTLMKLRKMETVKTELIADLQTVNQNAQAEKIAMIDNYLVAFGKNDGNIYRVNLNSKQVEQKIHVSAANLSSASTPKEQDMIVFTSGDKNIAVYNKDNATFSAKEISYPNDNVKIACLFMYNRRLYVLDSANNQIYKHFPTLTGFDKGSAWLQDSAIDVRDAVSLAIDGDLFILKNSGEILKLANGQKSDWLITGLDPILEKPVDIWTYNNVTNIYILEPANRRVVVLNKEGKLLVQYTATEWQNPTGMVINEAGKTGYILDQNKIYKFNF